MMTGDKKDENHQNVKDLQTEEIDAIEIGMLIDVKKADPVHVIEAIKNILTEIVMNVDDLETRLGKIIRIVVEEMKERMMQIMNGAGEIKAKKIQMKNHKKKKSQILHCQENLQKHQIKFMELS
jgi:hypothetical protein